MKMALLALACTLCGSCARSDDVELLKAKVVSLEIENSSLKSDLKIEKSSRTELETRLAVAETNITTLFERKGDEGSSGSWVLWDSQVGGPIGGGFRRAQPRFAYSSQEECMSTISYNMKKLGGNEGTGVWTSEGYTYRASCLPKGVEPR